MDSLPDRTPHAVLAERVLASLPARDREILIRYYLNLQPACALVEEFGVSPEEFRTIRANARGLFRALRAQMSCLKDFAGSRRSLSA